MAGVSNQIVLTLKGVDSVSGMFSRVGRNLLSFTAIAAGIGLAVRQTIRVASEMSAITDRAKDANATAGALQSMVQALGEIGVRGADLETVSRAMQEMTRRTGMQGAEGFAALLTQISKVNDAQERSQLLMASFGRAGVSLAPLVAEGEKGVQTFLKLAGAQIVASEAAMAEGDRLADVWSRTTFTMKQAVMESVGNIIGDFRRMFAAMGLSANDVIGGIAKAIKYFFDSIRAVVAVVEAAVLGLRAIFDTVANTLTGIVGAIASAITGDFELAGQYLADIPKNVKESWTRLGEVGAEMLPQDLFKPLEEAGALLVDEEAEKAAQTALETLQKGVKGGAAEGAAKGAKTQFAQAVGYGTNEAAKLLFGYQNRSIEQQALTEQKQTNTYLAGIVSTMDALEAI